MTPRLDSDGWAARLSHLASLARVDALAIVLPAQGVPQTYSAHNLPATTWAETPAAEILARAYSSREPGQVDGASVPLANGRTARAMAAAPIVYREQLIGALVAASEREIGDGDLGNLARAADMLAVDLAEANLAWRAQRYAQDLEGRGRIIRELRRVHQERDVDAILARAIDLVADLVGADGVSIMIADDDGMLRVRAARGIPEEARRTRVRVGEGIAGGVARSGQPTLLSGPVAGGSDSSATESMIVPLRVMDRTFGVLNVKHRTAQQRFSQQQLESLALVAQDIGFLYSSATELRQAEDDRQQAIVLYELAKFATLGSDPTHDSAAAAGMLAGALHIDYVSIWHLQGDKLRLRAAVGTSMEPGLELELEESDTTLATALREKKPVRERIETGRELPRWADARYTQYLLCPIGSHGLLVMSRESTEFSDADADFANTVGEYLVGMLQKSSAQDVVDRGVSTERRKIAQEIHDGLAQELTGVVLALEGCQRAFEKDPALLGPQLQKAARDARATLADVRQYMAALRQSETGALNLPVTLGRLVDDLRRQTGLHVEMEESGPQRELEPIVERAVIRIVGESLRNVAQHAGANKAKVTLRYGTEGVVATIEDDGKGFDVDAMYGTAEGRGHFGVVGMRERADAAGGELVIRSEPGRGTIVRASIPYASLAAVPGMSNGPIEDVEQQRVEEQADRGGFFARLFGR